MSAHNESRPEWPGAGEFWEAFVLWSGQHVSPGMGNGRVVPWYWQIWKAAGAAKDFRSKEQNLTRIRANCAAYESGFGHGLQADGERICNPYATFSDESLAYGFGYEAGFKKRRAVDTTCVDYRHELRVLLDSLTESYELPAAAVARANAAWRGELKTSGDGA